MKIKKKDLRKGEAQLPINYPDPIVEQPQETFDEREAQVEQLCKRLAHNEVVVRDEALAQVPPYVQRATAHLLTVEANVDKGALCCFFDMQRKRRGDHRHKSKELSINVLRELDAFRSCEENARREQRRNEAIQRLQRQQREEENDAGANGANDDSSQTRSQTKNSEIGKRSDDHKSVRQIYREWISQWAEVEILLLKLSRGLFFCLWHSDKPLVQLECAQNIARVIHSPHTNSGKLLWFSCMMRVLAKEWRTMDRYRSDKYLAFVRKLMFELFTLMKKWENESQLEQRRVKPSEGGEKSQLNTQERPGTNDGCSDRGSERGSSDRMDNITSCQPLCRALEEACYIFQQQVVPEPSAVGLTMHICDIFFDELCRSEVSSTLFIALGDRIALHAMSKGDFVEKRALDYFIAPIAGGVLETRLREQHGRRQQQWSGGKDTTKSSGSQMVARPTSRKRARDDDSTNPGNGKAQLAPDVTAAREAHLIITALADCCRRYSVSRGTFYSVRPMFAESEMALRQAADASNFVELTGKELRCCLEREVEEVDTTRAAFAGQRKKARLLKQREGRKPPTSKRKVHMIDGGSKKVSKRDRGHEVLKRQKKDVPRNTKRKKNYQLTVEDLYGDE